MYVRMYKRLPQNFTRQQRKDPFVAMGTSMLVRCVLVVKVTVSKCILLADGDWLDLFRISSDNITEGLVTAWLGDEVEILCNLPRRDNDTVVWYHGNRRLALDGSSGWTADPTGTILQFEASSALYQGWYTCAVREKERHSTQLIIMGRRDLSGGVCVGICVCGCMCACGWVGACMRVHVWVCACGGVGGGVGACVCGCWWVCMCVCACVCA